MSITTLVRMCVSLSGGVATFRVQNLLSGARLIQRMIGIMRGCRNRIRRERNLLMAGKLGKNQSYVSKKPAMANERVRVRGVSVYRPIIYGSSSVLLTQEERRDLASPDHTHRWTVALRSAASLPDSDQVGGADDMSYFIKRVTFKLHDTYANPTRNIDKPPYEVTETGWGEFEAQIRIYLVPESGEKVVTFYHHIKLHPWVKEGDPEISSAEVAMKLGPVHAWQYDELVFNDPYQNFLNLMNQHPPTSLPKVKTRPVPYSVANPASLESSRGGVPEFTAAMEKDELERLEEARKVVVAEEERWRAKLAGREKELERLQREVDAS